MTREPRELWREAVVSCLFLGRVPLAPGTAGTVGAVALAFAVGAWLPDYFTAVTLLLAALLYLVGWSLAEWCERYQGAKDPGLFVLDEVVGYLVAVAWLGPDPWVLGGGFVLFRLFDVWKPWPARRLEAVGGGHGILLDDLAAGLYAALLLGLVALAVP